MDEQTLKALMDKYGDVTYKRDLIAMEKKQLQNKVIPVNIQAELESIDAEFKDKEEALDIEEKAGRKILDAAVREYIKGLDVYDKMVIKSKLITLTVAKGDVVWNPDALDAYAIAGHPEILSFRKEEEPKTRITKNKL